MKRYLVIGGTCGLAWAAAMRGWMAQLAEGAPDMTSEVTWMTLALLLLPGVAVGALLGYSAWLRSAGKVGSRWLVFTPAIFATALLDPTLFIGLVTKGTGSGALIVITTAMSVAFVLTRPRWSVRRVLVTLVGAVGLLFMFAMGGVAAPLHTPRGAWVGLLGLTLVLLLGVACVLPHRPVRASVGAPAWIALGSLVGLTWAAGLRAFMAQVALRAGSEVSWSGTFGWLLAPGLVAGGLLGWAGYLWWNGGPRRARWLALSPFLFASLLVPPVAMLRFDGFLAGGIGGGTIALPAFAVLGGYAIVGSRTWLRFVASLFPLSSVPVWALTATDIGGAQLGLDTTRGLWVALYFWSFIAVLVLGCAPALGVTPAGVRDASLRGADIVATGREVRSPSPSSGSTDPTTDSRPQPPAQPARQRT